MTDSEFLLEYARHVPAEFPLRRKRLEEIAARLEWRPIKDLLRDGRRVQFYAEDIDLIWIGNAAKPHWKQERGLPTHWRPLPDPPSRST